MLAIYLDLYILKLKRTLLKIKLTQNNYLPYFSHAFVYLPLKSGTRMWSSCSAKVDVIPRISPSISGPTVSYMNFLKNKLHTCTLIKKRLYVALTKKTH